MGNLMRHVLPAIFTTLGRPLVRLFALLLLVALQLLASSAVLAQQIGADFDHNTTGFVLDMRHQVARCETCHVKGIFQGTPKDCASCHGWNNPRATKVKSTKHIQTTASCENCHSSFLAHFEDAKFTHANVAPNSCLNCHNGSNAKIPTNPSDSMHTNALAAGKTCGDCHTTLSFTKAGVRPGNHIPVSATSTCQSCHNPLDFAQMPTISAIHANAPSTSANCADCHSAANAARFNVPNMVPAIVAPPANHIGTLSQSCEACHVGPNSSIASTPIVGGANFGNSAFNHNGISTGCATCHGSAVGNGTFFGVVPKTTASLSPDHIPTTLACEVCHTNNVPAGQVPLSGPTGVQKTFAGGQFTHAGIANGCVTCHGPNVSSSTFYGVSNVVVMPPSSGPTASSHLPTSTTCENCHAGSTPSVLMSVTLPRALPGSGFQLPAPSAGMIHAGVSGSCSSCHDTGYVWMGMDRYPITTVAPFTGFQTRPQLTSGTFYVADSTHPTTGDCSQCHGGFTNFNGPSAPANHIPYAAAAQCSACHVTFTTAPTVAAIHANIQSTSTNCAQCHSAANAAIYAATTTLNPIVTPPSNHIGMGTLGCENCHVGAGSSMPTTPVQLGAKFSSSAFSHAGIGSASCATCHGASVTSSTFYGVFPKTMASLSPAHVPATAACDVCHTNSVPSMLIAPTGATGGQTTFGNAQFSHGGITTGCASCHGPAVSGSSFYGISSIIVMPPSGVPGAASHLPTPTTQACEACHAGSTPTALVAANATASTPGSRFALPAPTTSMIHNGVSSNCASCHDTNFVWMGMGKYPITTSAPFTGFQTRPQASSGTFFVADASHPNGECSTCHTSMSNWNGPSASANHIPYSAAATCSSCHGDFSTLPTVAKIHANLQSNNTNCAQCHSAANAARYNADASVMHNQIVTVPGNHISMGSLGCESCHVGTNSSITSTPVPDGARFSGSLFSHSGATTSCASCHGASVTPTTFAGVYPMNINSLSPVHVPTTAACDVCHTNNVPTGLVPSAGMTTFAGGKFSHSGITNGCIACHGPTISNTSFYGITGIVMMPPTTPTGATSHLPTSTTCENCHAGSTPSTLLAVNGTPVVPGSLFRNPVPTSTMIHGGVTSGCIACHESGMSWLGMDRYPRNLTTWIAGNTYTGFHTRPLTVGSGFSNTDASPHPTTGDCSQCHGNTISFGSPAAPANHIPYKTGASCGACHTSFGTAPTVTAIHTNLQSQTTNCVQCHSAANAALYASSVTINPIKTPAVDHIPMGNLGCESCHVGGSSSIPTTPVPTGAHFDGAVFSHSGISTNCGTCHGPNVLAGAFSGTTFATTPPKGINGLAPAHIPVSNSVGCETCHTNSTPSAAVPLTGYSGTPNFSGAKFSHSLITGNCEQCHGVAASGTAYYGLPVNSIARLPSSGGVGTNFHIPTDKGTATCADCHMASMPAGLVAGVYTGTSPTLFRLPAPASTIIHNGVSGSCASCHESGQGWMGMDLYPRSPNVLTTGAQYKGFNARPINGGSGYAFNDSGHPATGDCAQCHGSTVYFGAPALPANHIPFASGASCTSCHQTWGTHPTIAAIHANIQSTTTNCAQCHSAANATAFNSTIGSRPIVGPAGNHVPMRTLGCEACHVGAGMIATPVTAANFSGAKFSHSGMNANCAECHGNSVTTFQGITSIIKMPATTPTTSGAAHFPVTTSCESCHLGSMPASLVPANATLSIPGSGFLLPAPTSAQIHAGVSTCNSCHEKDYVWVSIGQYPKVTSPKFTGFQTRPYGSPTTAYAFSDTAHPVGGDCSTCHTGYTEWQVQVKPANHIPYAAAATCSTCHTTANYSTMPAVGLIHANIQNTSANCVQCHSVANAANYNTANLTLTVPAANHIPMANLGCESCHVGNANTSITATPVATGSHFSSSAFNHSGSAATCASCHGSSVTTVTFQGGQVPKQAAPLTPVHVPYGSLDCGVCHTTVPTGQVRLGSATGANTFAGGQFSHTGVTTCDACHGPSVGANPFYGITSIVTSANITPASPVHIPASNINSCEACHSQNTPASLVAANAVSKAAGTTKFFTAASTGAQIHTGVSGTCSTCHEAGMNWLGMSKYPRVPAVKTAGATYTGFHTRPQDVAAGNSIADTSHPATGDCSQCHGSTASFTVAAVPSNHIPFAAGADCTVCHTNFTAANPNFNVIPTTTNIHKYAQSLTTNCAQCHSPANALNYAIPSAGFSIKSPTSPGITHIPFGSTACEVCHVYAGGALTTPVTTGMTFANGKFSHTGITTGCATCHGAGVTNASFTGVTAIVAIPASSNTPLSTRHIPYTAACEACHSATTPSALLSVTTTGTGFASPVASGVLIHANSTSLACMTCHERAATWMGMANYPRSPATVSSVSTTQYRGFQTRPGSAATTYGYTNAAHTGNSGLDSGDCSVCHAGTAYFTGEGKPAGHMLTTASTCTTCHLTAGLYGYNENLATGATLHSGSSVTAGTVKALAGALGATSTCLTCHTAGTGTGGIAPFAGCATVATCTSPPPITYQPMLTTGAKTGPGGSLSILHVPIGKLDCKGCHSSVTTFGGTTVGSTGHSNVLLAGSGLKCLDCHEYRASPNPIFTGTNITPTGKLVRVPSKHTTASRMAPNDCSNCHSYNGGFRGLVRPVMREAMVSPDLGRVKPGGVSGAIVRGGLGNTFDHTGVEGGKCKTCHDGKSVSGLPARHLMTGVSCDVCHATSGWKPAQFNHRGIMPNTCLACHNGVGASRKPNGHFMTARSCDSCHRVQGWSPVQYSHLSPNYRPGGDPSCVSCHITNGEIIPRQMRAQNRVRPIPVGP